MTRFDQKRSVAVIVETFSMPARTQGLLDGLLNLINGRIAQA
jgi:hypothetical protein